MTYEHIRVEPLTPTIGATVEGVDLTEALDDAVMAEINEAWAEHLVLFFRDQPMNSETASGVRPPLWGPAHSPCGAVRRGQPRADGDSHRRVVVSE